MQHHLFSAVSRRSFLSAIIAGTGSLALWPRCLQASGNKLRRLSFIVVSDTHLGYRDQDHAARLWEKTAAEVAKANGDLVLHLGDIVDGGRESQYPLYVDLTESVIACAGVLALLPDSPSNCLHPPLPEWQ